jgi:hypothetical protein
VVCVAVVGRKGDERDGVVSLRRDEGGMRTAGLAVYRWVVEGWG